MACSKRRNDFLGLKFNFFIIQLLCLFRKQLISDCPHLNPLQWLSAKNCTCERKIQVEQQPHLTIFSICANNTVLLFPDQLPGIQNLAIRKVSHLAAGRQQFHVRGADLAWGAVEA